MKMGIPNWKPLPAFEKLPILLAKAVFSSQSYTLHVTDLANVWVETLDRKGIGRRSLNEDTSIDPTEGPDQMAMLLNKIQAALDPSARDDDQTSISLAVPSRDESGTLALTITCQLPDGLKPLKWTFQLAKCPPASVASHLVLPLLQAQHIRAREVQDLLSTVQEKEHVIDKLVDKLEHSGVGLDSVFNALSGRRKPSRDSAGNKVKGLAPFETSVWRSKQLPAPASPDTVTSLLEDVFSKPIHDEDQEISFDNDLNDWWQKLGSNQITAAHLGRGKEVAKDSKHAQGDVDPPDSRLAADEDDDFQVQATPPHLASIRKGRTAVDHDTTTDDEAEAIPDSHPTPSRHVKSRLGTIAAENHREAGSPPSPKETEITEMDTASDSDDEPVKSPSSDKKATRLGQSGSGHKEVTGKARATSRDSPSLGGDDDVTSELDNKANGKPQSSTPPAAKHEVPRRRLGAIGRISGRKAPTSTQPENRSNESEALQSKPMGRKIGAISKRRLEDQRPDSEMLNVGPEEADPEEQKAERKRAELAEELARKAAAKPVKKRRKF